MREVISLLVFLAGIRYSAWELGTAMGPSSSFTVRCQNDAHSFNIIQTDRILDFIQSYFTS